MLSSQSTQAKDLSFFPLCSNDPTTPSGRPTSTSEEPGDFDALFADLSSTAPSEPVPAADPGATFVPALNLAFLPPPVAMGPIPDVTLGGEGEAAEGEDLATAESAWASSWSGVVPPAAMESYPSTTPSLDPMRVRGLHLATTTGNDEAGSGLASITSATEASDRIAAAARSIAEGKGEEVRVEPDPFGFASGPNAISAERTLRLEEFAANLRPGRTPIGEEKIAGADEPMADAEAVDAKGRKKSFLNAGEEMFASHAKALGTDGAKPGINMATSHFNAPTTHPRSDYMLTPVNAAPAELARVATVEETHDTFSTAREAVEVVLHAVEHVASQAQRSVQLSFSVAGEELAVRVELRADEVRTTFRTGSAELRAALAQEWQQVATAAHTDRPVRIAPAVFAAAENSALNAFAGDTSSQGRHQGAARGEAEAALVGIRARAVANPTHPVAVPSLTAPVRTRGSHRLHTLA
jgi:hypothetical protein